MKWCTTLFLSALLAAAVGCAVAADTNSETAVCYFPKSCFGVQDPKGLGEPCVVAAAPGVGPKYDKCPGVEVTGGGCAAGYCEYGHGDVDSHVCHYVENSEHYVNEFMLVQSNPMRGLKEVGPGYPFPRLVECITGWFCRWKQVAPLSPNKNIVFSATYIYRDNA